MVKNSKKERLTTGGKHLLHFGLVVHLAVRMEMEKAPKDQHHSNFPAQRFPNCFLSSFSVKKYKLI